MVMDETHQTGSAEGGDHLETHSHGAGSLTALPELGRIGNPRVGAQAENQTTDNRIKSSAGGTYANNWMGSMVMPHEAYLIDQEPDKLSTDLISGGGHYVQLPQTYAMSSNKDMFNYMIDSSSLLPIENYRIGANYSAYPKINPAANLAATDQSELGEAVQNITKNEISDVSSDINRDISCGMMPHSNTQPQFCVYCNKYLKPMEELNNHIILNHAEQSHMATYMEVGAVQHQIPACPSCDCILTKIGPFDSSFSLDSANQEDQNMNLYHGEGILMVCPQCSKEYTLSLSTDPVPPPIQPEQERRHHCQHCQRSYKHNRDLLKHLRSCHNVDTSDRSQQSTVYTSGMQSNYATSGNDTHPTQPGKLTCHICKKMFRGPFELKRHNHTVHENKRPYKCKECTKSFRDAYELKRHSSSHARMRYHNLPVSGPGSLASQLEMSQGSNNTTRAGSEIENPRSDVVSNNIMSSSFHMGVPGAFHPNSGPTDYFCHTCEKNFRGANEFKRHYSVVHEKKYRYKCLHCGKLWRDQYDLKRHCLRSHKMDKDIDRNFIRQCLLENNTEGSSVAIQPSINIPAYDVNDGQPTITLNQETAQAIFGSSDRSLAVQASHLDQFNLLAHSDISRRLFN